MAISFIRTIILYLTIVLTLRIMGKRQMGELEPAEFVVAVIISDLATHPLQDPGTPLLYGLIPVLTLLACEVLITFFNVKSIRFRSVVCGKPSFIIMDGKIKQSEMKKNRLTIDELYEELRKKSITDISTVKHAILETDGTLSTLPYPNQMPVTPQQMNLNVEPTEYPVIVINDGRILNKNLKAVGRNEEWLQKELRNRNIKNANEVFLMTTDRSGKIYFAANEAKK